MTQCHCLARCCRTHVTLILQIVGLLNVIPVSLITQWGISLWESLSCDQSWKLQWHDRQIELYVGIKRNLGPTSPMTIVDPLFSKPFEQYSSRVYAKRDVGETPHSVIKDYGITLSDPKLFFLFHFHWEIETDSWNTWTSWSAIN